MKGFYDVQVGDVIVAFDSSAHDYEEHEFEVTSIENDGEDGVVLYGNDLTYPESEGFENYLGRVTEADFCGVTIKDVEKLIDEIKFEYSRAKNQTAHMFSGCHTKFNCKMRYKGKVYRSTYQCNVGFSDMSKIKKDFLCCVLLDADSYNYNRDLEGFCREFGYDYYENRKEAMRVFTKCEKAFHALDIMFEPEELYALHRYFREW